MNNKKKRMATAKLPAVYHANLRPTEGGKLKLSEFFLFFPSLIHPCCKGFLVFLGDF
jgi:hypothetical protein